MYRAWLSEKKTILVAYVFFFFLSPFPFGRLDVWNLIPGEGSADIVKAMVKGKIQVQHQYVCVSHINICIYYHYYI